jgi:hypothetical protein
MTRRQSTGACAPRPGVNAGATASATIRTIDQHPLTMIATGKRRA